MKKLNVLILSCALLFSATRCASDNKRDRFDSFDQLSKVYEENKDFSIFVQKKDSDFLILAIHGGALEPVTDTIARDVANQVHSLYLFTSLQTYFNKDLHITSSKYDEGRFKEIAKTSKVCVSFHGFKSEVEKTCLGGSQKYVDQAKNIFGDLLKVASSNDSECKKIGGSDNRNVIYRCREGGVQFELSKPLRKKYESDLEYRKMLTGLFKKYLSVVASL